MHVVYLPRFLFSDKLAVLKLQGPISISASVSFHLPNLETIHLSVLKFPGDEFMKKLSSSCPVLRELHIINCYVKATICVESLSLKSLIRKTRTSQEKVSIAIKTPNLTYLVLDEYRVSVDIGEMRSLNKAEVNFFVSDFQVEELLTKVSGVKYLHLRPEALLILKELPVFPNLIWLKSYAGKKLSKPLHSAPKLKSLIILYFNEDLPFDPKFAPEHLPCLESVEICSFCGNPEELDIVAYFLKAATALKKMKIIFDCCISEVTTLLSVFQELLDIPRSSAVCQIKISKPDL
ncbi:F-box/FBD/LRR-repeat protein At1g78750-like [Chenopodium quinoa]|uniref:F-box/FBD/LRR-repeat protein At1g78750-like n=1 Tax=Chenopodium quinoa TaxID=63459 RepID=UPI000B76FF1F|nr:F-box/FBD/LRR-repeat protein At1g78750-like [Chenopodium quinoa]